MIRRAIFPLLCRSPPFPASPALVCSSGLSRLPPWSRWYLPYPPQAAGLLELERRAVGRHQKLGGQFRMSLDSMQYVWVPGVYAVAPFPHAVCVPGRWVRHRAGWVGSAGHWRQ
jgi:hypothetical protein